MKLVMTLLVRDEQDILRDNLDFHLAQGVDFFVITDNGSMDATARIIEAYVRAGLAERIWQPQDDFSQARWVTHMARRAATVHGADWVINNDADEFWWARDGLLRDELAGLPADCEALEVQRHNHPPLSEASARAAAPSQGGLASMVYRERCSTNAVGRPLHPKVCHRAFGDVDIIQGNHRASRKGVALPARPAPSLAISHFPMRDYATFERKIVSGGAAYARNTELDASMGRTWRRLYELWRQGELRDWYDTQVLHPEQVAQGLTDGALIEDRLILDTLERVRGR